MWCQASHQILIYASNVANSSLFISIFLILYREIKWQRGDRLPFMFQLPWKESIWKVIGVTQDVKKLHELLKNAVAKELSSPHSLPIKNGASGSIWNSSRTYSRVLPISRFLGLSPLYRANYTPLDWDYRQKVLARLKPVQ